MNRFSTEVRIDTWRKTATSGGARNCRLLPVLRLSLFEVQLSPVKTNKKYSTLISEQNNNYLES